jgi:hypothetical protein
MIGKFTDVLTTVLVVAGITALVLPKRQTASVIKASGGAFSSVIKAATGQK